MKKLRYILLLPVLFLFTLVCANADSDILMSIGHKGRINEIAFDAGGSYLFSAGEDGTVRIWERRTTKLVQTFRVSYLPLLKIAVNPAQREFAVLEEGTLNDYTISVWNWENGKKLFSYKLDEVPMQLSYSPGGTFLAFSRTAWNSLTFLDSRTGRPLPFLKRGFGIVSNFIISGSEQTIMTYHPSGSIQYWDIRTGTKKQGMNTQEELKGVGFSSNGRYMSGYANSTLQVIDLVTGKTAAHIDSQPLEWTMFDTSSRRVYTLFNEPGKVQLDVYIFDGVKHQLFHSIPIQKTVSSAGYSSALYLSFLGSGIPASLNIHTRIQTDFVAADLTDITDMAFLEEKAVFTSPATVFICTSDIFSSESTGEKPEDFRVDTLKNPFQSTAGVTPYRDNVFLLWQKGGDSGGMFHFLDTETMTLSPPEIFSSPLISLEIQGSTALTLEADGTCTIINLETMERTFSFSSFGIQAVCFAGYSRIVAGKSKASGFDSSLMEINVITGETVLIEDSNLFTYDVVYDARSKQIYSLGIQNIEDHLKSVFKVHTGTHFEYARIISTFNEEDATASLAIDPASYRVFTSLGFDLIRQYKGYGITFFEKTPRIPRELDFHGKLLYAINRDRSISVWDGEAGKKVTDFYILAGGEWIALFGGETFTGTGKAQEFLSVNTPEIEALN